MMFRLPATRHYILVFSLFFIACDNNNMPEPMALVLNEEINLALTEPSGLSLSDTPNQLICVSDQDNRVYRVNLDGTILATLGYTGDDIEGVTQNQNDRSIWIVEEGTKELVKLDVNGNESARFSVAINQNEPNNGLEGVGIDEIQSRLYIVTEKEPSLLITMDFDGNEISRTELNLGLDNSGIYYDPDNQALWILSDESKSLYQTDLQGNKQAIYTFTINKAEGVAVDVGNQKIYVVSDESSKLYIYDLP